MGASGAARARVAATIKADDGAFDALEAFIASVPFFTVRERLAASIAGLEILDNLLTHGEVGPRGVLALAGAGPGCARLAFYVEAHPRFAEFAAKADEAALAGPRFDEAASRWRGLGLTMCGNLASKVSYRPGSACDRVFLRFDRRPGEEPQA